MLLYMLMNIALVVSQTCNLIIPNDPLTSIGLATPYIYEDCDQLNPDQSSFVEAVIINKLTSNIRIYTPLIINKDMTPLVPPVVPYLDPNDVVGIWFGSNADILIINNDNNNICVNGGLPGDYFGQVAACNAELFFLTVDQLVQNNVLKIPEFAIGFNGYLCPGVRSFSVVDMDQSDNVVSRYIVVEEKDIVQYSQDNLMLFCNNVTRILTNPSDNRLLADFINPALGCVNTFVAPDISNNNITRTAQALLELQAYFYGFNNNALVPVNNPMVKTNGEYNLYKTNEFRKLVHQPVAPTIFQASPTDYCVNFLKGLAQIILEQQYTVNFTSPNVDEAPNLFRFLLNRWYISFGPNGLNCSGLLNVNYNYNVNYCF